MRREGLPRSRRLSRTRDLAAVLRSGRRCRTPRVEIIWRPNDVGHPRLGLIVARHRHTVVARNRLRRRLREIARCRVLPSLAALDVVVRPRAAAYQCRFHELAADLEAWTRTVSK